VALAQSVFPNVQSWGSAMPRFGRLGPALCCCSCCAAAHAVLLLMLCCCSWEWPRRRPSGRPISRRSTQSSSFGRTTLARWIRCLLSGTRTRAVGAEPVRHDGRPWAYIGISRTLNMDRCRPCSTASPLNRQRWVLGQLPLRLVRCSGVLLGDMKQFVRARAPTEFDGRNPSILGSRPMTRGEGARV
jgi:hypothetical protein